MKGKGRPSPRDFKLRFKCMIIWVLVNTSGSAKSKANKAWFLCSVIHPDTRTFSNFPTSPKPSSLLSPSVPSQSSAGKWQWGSTCWSAHQFLHANGSWLLKIYYCLFLSKVIISRLSPPNSCQLSQKLRKYNIFGISASSSDWIEISPTVSKLLGEGEVMGQAAQVMGLTLT